MEYSDASGIRGSEHYDPKSLLDISVNEEYELYLLRTGCGAVVDIFFSSPVPRHAAQYDLILDCLKNRTAFIRVTDQSLRIDFQIEDNGLNSWASLKGFGDGLALMLGSQIATMDLRINTLKPEVINDILKEARPKLRSLE